MGVGLAAERQLAAQEGLTQGKTKTQSLLWTTAVASMGETLSLT